MNNEPDSEGIRLLSFDGGDRRAVSQLMILDEFMRRVEWDRKSATRILPCDYFHMMAGVGTGGIIVILLTVLRMGIDEAIDTFLDIWQAVFADGVLDKVARSERLETQMESLLRRKGLDAGTKLIVEENEESSCKAFVCIAVESNLGLCRKFRNYSSGNFSYDPTVVQAVRATCAMPGLFTPVAVESARFVTGCYNFNNPAGEAIREACDHFGKHRLVACLLSLGCSRRTIHSMPSNMRETDAISLIAEATSDGEIVDRELGWRIGKSKVYCRLIVQGFRPRSSSYAESISDIAYCAKTFLEHYDTGEKMDLCVRLSEQVGRLTLQDISGLSEERATSTHGLPPLSAFFVERPDLIEKMHQYMFRTAATTQRRMVLSGLGGIGKTQITISFMLRFLSRFRHILFIDASSVQSIESGLVSKVRSLGARYSRTTAAESLEVLANPDHEITRDWAIVYDNVDDSKINIARYLPQCTFGAIVITTRNPNLGNLAPTAHLKLDVMSEEEAVDVLLRSAVPPPRTPTEIDRHHARAIAHELGYLPVALVQAGYFIKVHDCMEEYRQRLQELRPDILNRPAREQLDDHYHGVYATLDVTWPHLSPRAQSFLSILAFVKYTGFPLVLLYGAAILGFQFEPWNFVERLAPFQDTVQLLCDTFRPRNEWNEQDVHDLVAELERYSLVTRMTTFTVTMLRLHPLIHSWTHDRLSMHERERYQAAAIRILVCGSGDDDEDIHEFLFPHVGLFYNQISQLHVNDRAGIANIYAHQRDYKTSTVLWEGIWNDISVLHENNELVTSEVKLRLAALLWEPIHEQDLRLINRGSFHLNSMEEFSLEYRNQTRKALKMEHDAVECRIRALGVAHPMTVKANLQLARGIARCGKRDQAIAKLRDIIRFWEEQTDETWEDVVRAKEALAEICPKLESISLWEDVIQERAQRRTQEHHATLKAMEALARNYREIAMYQSEHPSERLKHYVSATDLWIALVATRTKRRGIRHPDTLDAMESLARSYWLQHDDKLSVEMWKQVKDLRKDTQGDSHKETLNAMEELAKRYIRCKPPQFKEAEVLRKELIRLREQSQGPSHDKTLEAIRDLADMYAESRNYDEAESQWVEVIKRTREKFGHSDERTIIVVTELARMYKRGKRYQQAESRWEEVIRLRMGSQETCHKLTLEAVQELANSYCQDHRYEKAETQLREVINLRSKLYGLDHESTVDAIGHLAQVYAEREQYHEAELEWRKVIVLRGESGMQTYNRARGAEGSLAQIYFRLGRYPEAEEMWRRVTNWSNMQGGDYRNALNGLERLAHMYTNRSWYTKAEALWNDVIYLRKEAHGLRHGRTLDAMTSLAKVHANCRRHTAAEALWREVILARKDMQGPHHKRTIAEMSELARMYAGCERYDEAEAQWKEVITVMDEMLVMRRQAQTGRADFFFDAMQAFAEMIHWNDETLRFAEDPWFLREDPQQIREKNTLEAMQQKIRARKELAEMYARCKRYDDAEAEWREVINLGSEMHSPAQKFFGMERLADIYMQRKRYQEAESLCKEVINQGTEFLGPDSPVIFNSMETLAHVYKECMRYTEAEALLKRMIALSVEVDSPPDDRDIRRYLHMLAEVYEECQHYKIAEAILVEAVEGIEEVHYGELPEPLLITQQRAQLTLSLERVRMHMKTSQESKSERVDRGTFAYCHAASASAHYRKQPPHIEINSAPIGPHHTFTHRASCLYRTLECDSLSDAMFFQAISCFGLNGIIGSLVHVFF